MKKTFHYYRNSLLALRSCESIAILIYFPLGRGIEELGIGCKSSAVEEHTQTVQGREMGGGWGRGSGGQTGESEWE